MPEAVSRICVLGGGSAGLLAALTMRRLLDVREVVVVRSPSLPVIGVGESTTAFLPVFLHRQLALDQSRFYADVRPVWKLGVRFEWGPEETSHFNYPFGFEFSERSGPLRKRAAYYCMELPGHPGMGSALMDAALSPCVRGADGTHHLLSQPHGYHIENAPFLAHLEAVSREFGVSFVDALVDTAERGESGDVSALLLDNGDRIEADLFVDCSGFRSFLLRKTLGESYTSYRDALFCDTAIVAPIRRSGVVLPFTTATTMNHGWRWRIDLADHVTVGYVHASAFCSVDEALEELQQLHPEVSDGVRVIRFDSGRCENFWCRNVVGIGNSCGFVEPLEATALHLIAEQLLGVCGALIDADLRIDPNARNAENRRFRRSWDAVRDFLALHYRFNGRRRTPFWNHCREATSLGAAEGIVDAWRRLGPHQSLRELVPEQTLVQYEGYLSLLLGQAVPTSFSNRFDDRDLQDWSTFQQSLRQQMSGALPVREGLEVVHRPQWAWH